VETWTLLALRPGLWTAAWAGLLVWALRRWWDAPPWRVTAVLAAAVAAVLGPMLVAGALMPPLGMIARFPPWRGVPAPEPFNPLQHDLVMQIVPGQAAVRAVTGAGEWPLWNPWLAAGQPLLADPLSQPFQPLVLAARLVPLAEAMTVTAALTLFAAMLGTWLLLHRQGIGDLPATAAALGWGLGGWTLHWLGWHQATVGALLPWLLYAVLLTAERRARRDFVLLGAVTASLLLAGHPETILYALLVGAAFGLVRARTHHHLRRALRSPRSGRLEGQGPAMPTAAWRPLARQAAAGAVALAVAAPLLLPFYDYLPQMVRYQRIEHGRMLPQEQGPWRGWRTAEERRESIEDATERLQATVAPGAFGAYWAGGYWGANNPNEDLSAFVGAPLALLALLALWPARRRLPGERFFLAVGLTGLVVLVQPPVLLPLLEALPGFGHSAAHHLRVTMLIGFAVAYLGAAVLDRRRRGDGPPRGVVAGAALLLASLVTWTYLANPNPQAADPPLLPTGPRFTWWLVALGVLAVTAVVLIVRPRTGAAGVADAPGRGAPAAAGGSPPLTAGAAALPANGAPPAGWRPRLRFLALLAVPVAVAVQLLALHLPLHPPAPARLFYPPTETGRLLTAHLPAVCETVEGGGFGRFTGLGPTYPANTAVLAGLMDVRSSGPAQPAAFSHITERLKPPKGRYLDTLGRGDSPVLDLLAVRYVAVWPDAPLPPPARPVLETPVLHVWERPRALPLVFLPESAETFRGGSWLDWIFGRDDHAARSLVHYHPGGLRTWRAAAPAASAVGAVTLGAARLSVALELAEERLLATSVYQDGQWRLLADGVRVAPVLVNGPFVGAWLPAGTARLEALYRPRGFVAGCLLAALGLAAALACGLAPVRGRGAGHPFTGRWRKRRCPGSA
jgi:hypothetical protein